MNSENTWTTGPWRYADGNIFLLPDDLVATLIFTGGDDGLSDEDADAVGYMMGATPELRDALERAVPFLERLGDFIGNGDPTPSGLGARCDALLAARNALAKARGER